MKSQVWVMKGHLVLPPEATLISLQGLCQELVLVLCEHCQAWGHAPSSTAHDELSPGGFPELKLTTETVHTALGSSLSPVHKATHGWIYPNS